MLTRCHKGCPHSTACNSAADLEDAGIVAVIDLRQRNVGCGRAEDEFLKQVQRQAGKITAVGGSGGGINTLLATLHLLIAPAT